MIIRGGTVSTPIKPERNLVKATNLNEEEKAQARDNIGAASKSVEIKVAEQLGAVTTFPLSSGYYGSMGTITESAAYKHTEKIQTDTLYTFKETVPHSVATWLSGVYQGLTMWDRVGTLGDFNEVAYNFNGFDGDYVSYGTDGELAEKLNKKADIDAVYGKSEIDRKFGISLALSSGYYGSKGTITESTAYKHTEKLQTDTLYSFGDVLPHSVATWLGGVCQGLKTWDKVDTLGVFDEIAYNFYGYSENTILIIEDTYLSEQVKNLQAQNAMTSALNHLQNKTVAIIGDSISTNGADGTDKNAVEIEIQAEDVGVQLSAYLTYYDVYNFDGTASNLTIGGHTFTDEEIGNEVTFTPTAEDVGKCVGKPNTYYGNGTTIWWEYIRDMFGCRMIPVCWSGASITSHEADQQTRKTAHSWHEAQIRKCGIRTAGTMDRTSPDIILVYRGTNDFSHSPYTVLTPNYGNSLSFEYPTTDDLGDGNYGYKEGLVLLVSKLRAAYPTAQIVLCTLNVFKRVNYAHFPTNNGINTLPQYNNAIREIADLMGCGVIEFDKDGITFENCYTEGYITDSATMPTHPCDKGQKVMGMKAIADLTKQYVPLVTEA